MRDSVTREEFFAYVQAFLSTLEATARQHLPPRLQKSLFHWPYLDGRVIAYASTTWGVAMESVPSAVKDIQIVAGSDRVEELITRLPIPEDIAQCFFRVGARDTLIHGLHLQSYRCPFVLNEQDASLTLIDVLCESPAGCRQLDLVQVYGDNRASSWTERLAVERAKDAVIAAIVEMNRSRDLKVPLDEYIDKHKAKTVLVLGSYDPLGMRRLLRICDCLRAVGYNPLMVSAVPDHPHQTLEQKVCTLAGLSRFVVMDDSTASGYLAELPVLNRDQHTIILMHCEGQRGSYMSAGLAVSAANMKEFDYTLATLDVVLHDATAWAETRLEEVSSALRNTYPWRQRERQ